MVWLRAWLRGFGAARLQGRCCVAADLWLYGCELGVVLLKIGVYRLGVTLLQVLGAVYVTGWYYMAVGWMRYGYQLDIVWLRAW